MSTTFADAVRAGAGRASGEGAGRCLLIAEVAQAHDGSLGLAHAYIDAAAAAGADAVKFQTHLAEAESTPAEPWRVRFSPQDDTRYSYWQRTAFSESQWGELRAHAEALDLLFLSSPFSTEAVSLLTRVGVAAWKIPSGEVATPGLLEQVAATGWPVLLSTGMSPMGEVDRAVDRLRTAGVAFAVLQCTSAYPCPPELVGLNLLGEFRQRYGCPVGLSDHSGTIYPALAAVTLGVDVLELHITLSRDMYGPDVAASVTTAEFRQLADGVRFIERMNSSPVAKDALAGELAPLRALFTKSVVATRPLSAGHVLTDDDLAVRKPGTGIAAGRRAAIVGRVLARPVAAWRPLVDDDLLAVSSSGITVPGGFTSQSTVASTARTRRAPWLPGFPAPAAGPGRPGTGESAVALSAASLTEPPMRGQP
ncbi:MAG: N-acetylneuraminate synthase family protein [Gemmatimonadaceae bacterium]